jgi:hypothetical protein
MKSGIEKRLDEMSARIDQLSQVLNRVLARLESRDAVAPNGEPMVRRSDHG